ncbi:MAG: thiol oxidoreductase [Bacteroidetes bacterium]|nr:thiol oxidoreductase [Bacteroidota bacterium]
MKKLIVFIGLATATGLLVVGNQSCQKSKDDVLEANETMNLYDEALQGGNNGTINLATNLAFTQALPGLPTSEVINFKVGRSFFHTAWVMAPASTTAVDGLGPLFNTNSCNSCHIENGRGRTPFSQTESLNSIIIRVSDAGEDAHGGPKPNPDFGLQFRNKSTLNASPDGDVTVSYTEKKITYPDGSSASLREPSYHFTKLRGGAAFPQFYSPRIANQIAGAGLLDAISEETILSFADELDANADGISGRPNYVWDDELQQTRLGRFGWKANEPSVRQQAAGALSGDMGITSPIYPNPNLWGTALALYSKLPSGSDTPGEPELPEPLFSNLVFYVQGLSVPQRRAWTNPEVLRGKALFAQVSCNKCHKPQMPTGSFPQIPLLSNQVIHPYTDLLLHDMGPALADGRKDFLAEGNEWRTAPLWGIGLVNLVNNNSGMFLLHDGRARTIEEAILWHGGEAEKSKQSFMNLPKSDRDALIKFVNDL